MAEVRMDAETRARMMSLMPCSSTGTYEWVPEVFQEKVDGEYVIPKDKWPTLILRPLTTKEHAQLRRTLLSNGKIGSAEGAKIAAISDQMYEVVRKIVTGWRGIVDLSTGNEYTYEEEQEGGVKKDKWEMIPDPVKAELFSHVCRVSGLVKAEGADRLAEVRRGLG